ncbi:MAG: ATP-binding cassette domain-containing protein [Clostridiales bacterium]|nr:ATP-binding cassette domain-containing protein [Clostridiales bacterium]
MSLSVHIKKKLGDFRLQIDLEHPDGITGILGASGCGKSLTLKSIAGIVTPDEGRIVLNDRVLFDSEKGIQVKPQKRRVGYLFQNYALFPNMTLEKNILCGLCREKDRQIRKEKLEEVLAVMQLEEYRKAYPQQLSGGQQQRAALARILVSEPDLLLLDEPFSALDSYLRDQLQIQVREILGRFGKDVLLVSHSRDEIYHLCSRAALMGHGRVLDMGRTKEVFAMPGSRTGAILTGCKNVADAHKTGAYEVEIPDWGIRLKTAYPVRDDLCAVGIRAHYFHPKARENVFPVIWSSEMEEPFETTVLFRYAGQREGTPDIWWRIPKDRKPERMPKQLGIAPQNVLLLYPEL